MIRPEDYDADAPAPAATGMGTQYAPSSAAPPPFVRATTPASTSAGNSTPNPWIGVAVVLAVVLGLLLLVVVPARNKAAADKDAQAAANAASEAQRAEEQRVAERARVEQGIEGAWSNGSSRLMIQRTGNAFTATYVPANGVSHNLGVELLPDNQVKLRSDQIGKLVTPLRYWQGDFSQESWLELGVDGRSLSVRFSEAPGGRTVMMSRAPGTSVAAQPQQDRIVEQQVTVATDQSVDVSAKVPADERERQLAAEEEARSTPAARRAAEQAAQLEREQAGAAQAEVGRGPARQFQPGPESVVPDPAFARAAATERLTADTKTMWSATDAVIESGVETAYLRAAEQLRTALAKIEAFETANGSDSTTRGLWKVTVQKLNDDVIVACNAENVVRGERRQALVLCPSKN